MFAHIDEHYFRADRPAFAEMTGTSYSVIVTGEPNRTSAGSGSEPLSIQHQPGRQLKKFSCLLELDSVLRRVIHATNA